MDKTQNSHTIEALEALYHKYKRQIMAIACSVLHSYDKAEDVLQDTMVSVMENIDTISAMIEPVARTYILTIARNAALAICRKNKKRPTEISIYELGEMEDTEMDTFEQTLKKFTKERIKEALGQIPYEQAEVLVMKYVYQCEFEEISRMLNRKLCTVKQQAMRGKKNMLLILKENDD